MAEILETPKPKILKLADGKEYKIPPLNLNVMADIQEEFDCDFIEVCKKLLNDNKPDFSVLRKALYVLLRQNHPEVTIIDVGKLVESNQLTDVFQAIINMWVNK